MAQRPHDIYIKTIGGTDIGFMLTRANGRRSYSVQDAQTIAPRFLTEEQISQQQLPPDLALTFPQTSWHRGIGGIRYEASDPDVLADGTLIDVTERGVIKLARNLVASTVDSVPNEYVPSGFAVSGTQAWAFIGRDTYSWDFTNKNWDIQTEPVAAARMFRNGISFDGRIYVPSWADDAGSGGSYVAADEPVNYLHKTLGAAQWTLIANSGQTLEGPKYMAVADQKLWGGNWATAADSTLDLDGPLFDAASSSYTGPAPSSVTLSHTCANRSNRLLIVAVGSEVTAGSQAYPTGVTYAGVSLTALTTARTTINDGGLAYSISLWYLVAPATGANNVVVTFAGAQNGIVVGAQSFTGVVQTGTISDEGAATGISQAPSVTLSATAADEWVIDGVCDYGGTHTAEASQTSRWSQTASAVDGAGSTEEATGNSTTMSWTLGASSAWAIAAVAIVPVSHSSSATTLPVTGTPSSQFVAGDVIRMDSELMLVTAVSDSPGELTVVRGYRGSVAASHANESNIWEITESVNTVRSTTNGASYANWSTATSVADSGSAITALVGVGEQLVVFKTDGIYTLEADGTVTQRLPGGPAMGHANFGKGAWTWNDLVFIPLHNGGLWELETITWTIRDISFSHVMPDQSQYHGRIVAGGGEPSHMYVVVLDTTNTMYRVLMTQNPAQLGLSDYNWTQVGTISYTTGTDADHASALLAGVTNGSNTHDRLWVGIESTGSPLLLPRYITNSTIDGDDEYSSTSGEAYTVAFDAGFPNVNKRAQNIVLNTDNLGAVGGSNHYIDVRYRLDGDSWLYVHTGTGTNTDNGSSVTGDNQSKTFVAGVTFKKIEFRFTFVRRTTGNQTTPELHDFTFTCQLRTSAIKLLPLALYLANGLRLNNGMMENRAKTNRDQLRTWNTQGAEVVVTDAGGETRNCLFLPGTFRETELRNGYHSFPELEVVFTLAETG